MTDYALLNFVDVQGNAAPAIKVGEQILPLDANLHPPLGFPTTSTKEILQHWESAEPALRALATGFVTSPTKSQAAAAKPLSSARLLPPILYPDAIFCAFANYTDHIREMTGREPPDKTKVQPLFFIKLGAHCVVGPDAKIKVPDRSKQLDWEAELAVVIGRTAHQVSVQAAMDYVAGYTIINDLSLRDQMTRSDWNVRHDFLSSKSFDAGAPMGPWIVPVDQVKDVYNLTIKQWVDHDLRQNSTTAFMLFTIAEQIAYLSNQFTLRPGDVIATGSPSGNGRPLGIFLKPGQELTIEIQDIGRLHNVIV